MNKYLIRELRAMANRRGTEHADLMRRAADALEHLERS